MRRVELAAMLTVSPSQISAIRTFLRTELSQDIVSVDHRAARWWFVHLEYSSLAVVLSPVFVGQLDKLDGVWLDVDGKVTKMHHGVESSLEEDEDAHQLVEINIVIQGQDGGQSKPPEYSDGVPQD